MPNTEPPFNSCPTCGGRGCDPTVCTRDGCTNEGHAACPTCNAAGIVPPFDSRPSDGGHRDDLAPSVHRSADDGTAPRTIIEPPFDSREDDIETTIRVLRWCRANTNGGPHHIDLDRLIVVLDSVRRYYVDAEH